MVSLFFFFCVIKSSLLNTNWSTIAGNNVWHRGTFFSKESLIMMEKVFEIDINSKADFLLSKSFQQEESKNNLVQVLTNLFKRYMKK